MTDTPRATCMKCGAEIPGVSATFQACCGKPACRRWLLDTITAGSDRHKRRKRTDTGD
jgi:hypothetical protein